MSLRVPGQPCSKGYQPELRVSLGDGGALREWMCLQVRPLVGWWGEGGSAGSVLEDAASSDECHRSTLTLVHSPARTVSTLPSCTSTLTLVHSPACTVNTCSDACLSVLLHLILVTP